MNKKTIFTGLIILAVCLIVIVFFARPKKEFSERTSSPEANSLYETALSWQSKGKLNNAVKSYQQLVKQFPGDKLAARAWYKLGEIYEKEDLWPEAKEACAAIITNFPNFKQISDVEERLWNLNMKILFSPVVTESDIVYKVKPKDTLGKIAREYNTTVDLIKRSNNLKSSLIRPGKRLKISTCRYSVIIDKSQNSLTLKADDEIFKVYSVATGKFNCTPVGNFTIVEKLKNPDWYKGGEGIIPTDDPKNILGTRWLGFSEPQYGIHGGADSQDLGRQITNGCIRMTDADAEELFAVLPRGAEVIIVD